VRLESILAQRVVLEPDPLALLLVAGEAITAGAPERVAGKLRHPVERLMGPVPEGRGALRAVRLPGDVGAGGGPPSARGGAGGHPVPPAPAIATSARPSIFVSARAGVGSSSQYGFTKRD